MNAKDWVAETLRGTSPDWPSDRGDEFSGAVRDHAEHQGVAPLLNRILSRRGDSRGLPVALRDQLTDSSRRAAASELAIASELKSLLTACHEQSVSLLLIKGTPLAYSLYPEPYLRVRCDTDLLFPNRREADRAWRLLEDRGYRREHAIEGDSISTQFGARRRLPGGATITLDVHWGLSNQLVVARCFDYDELMSRSVGVPGLHPAARSPSTVDALMIACLHRAAHRPDGIHDRAIWLYDIRLLCDALGDSDRTELAARCRDKGVSRVVADGIRAAAALLNGADRESLIRRLEEDPSTQRVSMQQFANRWQREITQLRALDGARAKLSHVADHVLPRAEYVMRKYDKQSRWWLPVLYVRRFGAGLTRRFRR